MANRPGDVIVGGQYNSSAPTLTDGKTSAAQLDVNGNLKVVIAAAGSGDAVTVADGADVAQGTTTDAAVLNPGSTATTVALLKGLLSSGKTSIATVTVVSGTSHTAGDVLGPTGGGTSALTFATFAPYACEMMITTVSLEVDVTAVVSGATSYALYLYNVTPPSALADDAAWDLPSGDRASFIGSVNLGTPVDLGSTLYVLSSSVNTQITTAGTSIFGYLVTNGTYTVANPTVFTVTLHGTRI